MKNTGTTEHTMTTQTNPNHLAPLDDQGRDFESPNKKWFGTAHDGVLYFWEVTEYENEGITYRAKDLAHANQKIDTYLAEQE